ncbi:hypothetical protein KKG31_01165 [Patescibacteria group bacterium]|nr:hypothetical protein [Patescibacteria group bacterium]MBU0627266.1 hypothetical protein [Patescibacteria group bacterium]MBU1757789.1 hypothetical protein [Patescibacteria group bacterium]
MQQLYNTEDYKSQQTAMIQQVLGTTDAQEVKAETTLPEGNKIDKSIIEQINQNGYIK